ncbi:Putative nucleotidyltransferase [Neorhizobium galegae bv. orientalis]|nr:Putative nucleotidyltransferase [Neorhizobium galegae bv. orientalis]CDZ64171.1 Putative nucleotidyltransferase [Neorhizobium galegae bv. orientalis]
MLVIVNDRRLCEFAKYWYKAADRLIRDKSIETPVSFIVHTRREVNTYLKEGQYFFTDIRKEGIVLYELEDEPLAEPQELSPVDRLRVARGHFEERYSSAGGFVDTSRYTLSRGRKKEAAFLLHQSLEQAYSCVLLTLTNYGPPSDNIKFRRSLAEEQDWLTELVKEVCTQHLIRLERNSDWRIRSVGKWTVRTVPLERIRTNDPVVTKVLRLKLSGCGHRLGLDGTTDLGPEADENIDIFAICGRRCTPPIRVISM